MVWGGNRQEEGSAAREQTRNPNLLAKTSATKSIPLNVPSSHFFMVIDKERSPGIVIVGPSLPSREEL